MAELNIAGTPWQIDLIVFDKDGTLIDFNEIWGEWYRGMLGLLQEITPQLSGLDDLLNPALGYNPQTRRILPDSPLAVASTRELEVLTAGALYRAGLNWTEANEAVKLADERDDRRWRRPELIKPIGDVKGTLTNLRNAGVQLAVATSDNRQPTIDTLAALELTDLIATMICGDDPIPHKPDPAGYHQICRELSVAADRSIMVGDTLNDLRFGQNSGVAATLGITTGAGHPEILTSNATWVATSIDFLTGR